MRSIQAALARFSQEFARRKRFYLKGTGPLRLYMEGLALAGVDQARYVIELQQRRLPGGQCATRPHAPLVIHEGIHEMRRDAGGRSLTAS